MKNFFGKDHLGTLNAYFTTTACNNSINYRVSIMDVFKKYFDYRINFL